MLPILAGIAGKFLGGAIDSTFKELNMASQADYQKDLVRYQYELNSPLNQRRRLEAAGLNPALMMSSGGAGATVSASSAGLGSVSQPGSVGSVFDGLGQLAQLKLSESEARKNNAEAEGVENQNSIFDIYRQTMEANKDNAKAQARISESQAYVLEATRETDINIKNQLYYKAIADVELAEVSIEEKNRLISKIQAETDFITEQSLTEEQRREVLRAEVDLLESKNILTKAQADMVKEQYFRLRTGLPETNAFTLDKLPGIIISLSASGHLGEFLNAMPEKALNILRSLGLYSGTPKEDTREHKSPYSGTATTSDWLLPGAKRDSLWSDYYRRQREKEDRQIHYADSVRMYRDSVNALRKKK